MDDTGKRILQRIYTACLDPRNHGRLVFVENYGEQIAQYMVHGVDLWLNNPLPPYEACGTSGMKAAINGIPQLSTADGWWLEGFDGNNGWSFGGGTTGEDSKTADARSLYEIIATRIVPVYYEISEKGVPHRWVRIMKSAIKLSGAQFSARRMVTEQFVGFGYALTNRPPTRKQLCEQPLFAVQHLPDFISQSLF